MSKIVFLLNPVSGHGNKHDILEIIRRRTRQQGIEMDHFITREDGDYSWLEKEISNESVHSIVVVGGDGTISHVAAALRHTQVPIGVIPCGSGNGLAFAAGIPKNPDQALDIIFQGNHSPVDSFTINEHFSCMLSGIGFDAKVAHDFSRSPTRGFWSYAKLTAKHFLHAKPYPFELLISGHELSTAAFFISIANSNQFGNQVTIAPRASLSDGKLDIVVVQDMKKFKLVPAILHQLKFGKIREKHFRKNEILYFQTTSLHIKNPLLAPLHVDGDPAATSDQFEIRVIPNAFQLIQPK